MFCEYIRMENVDYENVNIEKKYLKKYAKKSNFQR